MSKYPPDSHCPDCGRKREKDKLSDGWRCPLNHDRIREQMAYEQQAEADRRLGAMVRRMADGMSIVFLEDACVVTRNPIPSGIILAVAETVDAALAEALGETGGEG